MLKLSPYAKKIIKKNNIDISILKGTGPNGRIIKRDLPGFDNEIKEKKIVISQIRKIIAERTTVAFRDIPHFYLKIESKIDKLINLKNTINNSYSKTKISLNDLLIKALAIAQKNNPKTLNQWIDNEIIKINSIDISVAVALEDGLITPIIKSADKKGINEISNEVKTLVKKAKNNSLSPDEYTGGTITISNLGMYGISEFDAIINPPQSCIIAIGEAKKTPVILNDEIIQSTIMKSTLSADHRVLDGAVAANFLKTFNDIIENPFQIWLESKDMKLN